MPRKHREVPISPEDGGSPKESRRGATGWPHLVQARAHPWPRLDMVWVPWPTSGSPLRHTSSPGNPKTYRIIEGIFRRLCGTENNRERKALRQGEICRGNSFPEGGKSSPSSPSSSWTSLGSSSSSPPPSPSSPPLHSVPL